MSEITKAKGEVSAESQLTTVSFMSNMASTLNEFSDGKHGDPPSQQETIGSASGIISN